MAADEDDTLDDADDSRSEDSEDGVGTTLALAAILSLVFFFGSYILATIINEVLGRHGLPWAPIVYAVVFFPVSLLVTVGEDRVQRSRYWPRIENYWYHGVFSMGLLVPPLLVVFFPQSFWQSLPRGGGIGVAVTATILTVTAVILRGLYARRKYRDDNDT